MIPPETSDFAPISVGIATLNRRLNEDDALSGNVAAGGTMVASGSRAAFRQPLQLRGGFKDFKDFKDFKVIRVVRDLNDSDNGKLLRSTFAIFFTEYSSYMWLRTIYSRSVMPNKFGITLGLFVYLQ